MFQSHQATAELLAAAAEHARWDDPGHRSLWGRLFPAGGLENLFHHSGNTPPRRSSSGALGHGDAPADAPEMLGQPEANSVDADYLDYCCSVLQHL